MNKFILISVLLMLLTACSTGEKKSSVKQDKSDTIEMVSDVSKPAGDPERGAEIFQNGTNGAPACIACHQNEPNTRPSKTAPNLVGVAERADERVEGLSEEEYITMSILNPGAYVVDGFSNIMYPNYAKQLSSEDVSDLIAYLLTL